MNVTVKVRPCSRNDQCNRGATATTTCHCRSSKQRQERQAAGGKGNAANSNIGGALRRLHLAPGST
jgi:hypothetical protein